MVGDKKKRDDLVLEKQEGEDREVKKRELQDLQNKREKAAKRQLASLDKEIVLLTKMKKSDKIIETFFEFYC